MNFSSEEIISLADALYLKRDKSECVEESISMLKYLGDDYDALWRISRAYFFMGQEAKTPEEKINHHKPGLLAGKQAYELEKKRVEACFWNGVNLALLAQLEKPFNAFSRLYEAKVFLRKAIDIDSSYHGAGPLRVLARLESKAPFILGGSKRRARRRYTEAIEIAPTNTVTRIYFAELLLETGKKEEARKQLETILQIEPDGVWDFEIKRDKKLASDLLKTF